MTLPSLDLLYATSIAAKLNFNANFMVNYRHLEKIYKKYN